MMKMPNSLMPDPRTVGGCLARSILLGALTFVAACESKWEQMPDHELAEKASECLYMNSPGPAQIQVCKNYKRECERRRKKGVYVC